MMRLLSYQVAATAAAAALFFARSIANARTYAHRAILEQLCVVIHTTVEAAAAAAAATRKRTTRNPHAPTVYFRTERTPTQISSNFFHSPFSLYVFFDCEMFFVIADELLSLPPSF